MARARSKKSARTLDKSASNKSAALGQAAADRKTDLADEWSRHEHVTPAVSTQAQKLIEAAGSPGLARHAVDAVVSEAANPRVAPADSTPAGPLTAASPQDALARQWGFRSYLEMFETSTLVRSAVGTSWRLIAVRDRGWIVWNEAEFAACGPFPTKNAAVGAVPSRDDS
jgi:hypothetical protein